MKSVWLTKNGFFGRRLAVSTAFTRASSSCLSAPHSPSGSIPIQHYSTNCNMEGRGLTLRSKSRRQRPQISAPKPISGPLPPNTRSPEEHPTRERAPQNDATSDLVKRRYSTRFAAPEFDSNAPPVPALPNQVPGGLGGLTPPTLPRQPSPVDPNSPAPTVDLKALRDPSLPVDRCKCSSRSRCGNINSPRASNRRCREPSRERIRRRNPKVPRKSTQSEKSHIHRFAAECLSESYPVHQNQ